MRDEADVNDPARERDPAPARRASGDDLARDVARLLEEEIVFGRRQPRERLIEEDLAQQFDVKRHVAREALAELERLGLVERTRNRGAVVRLYEAQEVEDINAVRELLESHAAASIPLPLGKPELRRLGELQRAHADAVEDGDRRGVFRGNIAFHDALFTHCGNAALIEAIRTYSQKSHAYRSVFINDRDYLHWAARAHLDMIEAIENRDREGLVRLCREHLAPAKDHYIAVWRARFS